MMDEDKRKKLTKALCFLWISTFLIVGICSNAYVIYATVTTGNSPISMLSPHQLSVLAVTLLYFLPLMIVINYNAKRANLRSYVLVSNVACIFLGAWSTIALIVTIVAYINPTLFA